MAGRLPLLAALRAACPGVPVRLHDDAVAVAVGEHWRGAGRGGADLLGTVVPTGVGGGVVLGGRVLQGRTGNAGHVGHLVVEPDGPRCGCGGRGCLEAVARGHARTPTGRPGEPAQPAYGSSETTVTEIERGPNTTTSPARRPVMAWPSGDSGE